MAGFDDDGIDRELSDVPTPPGTESGPRSRAPMELELGAEPGASPMIESISALNVHPDAWRQATALSEMEVYRTYRTELCPQFQNLGGCVYEDDCLFAHGAEQLRERERDAKCACASPRLSI